MKKISWLQLAGLAALGGAAYYLWRRQMNAAAAAVPIEEDYNPNPETTEAGGITNPGAE